MLLYRQICTRPRVCNCFVRSVHLFRDHTDGFSNWPHLEQAKPAMVFVGMDRRLLLSATWANLYPAIIFRCSNCSPLPDVSYAGGRSRERTPGCGDELPALVGALWLRFLRSWQFVRVEWKGVHYRRHRATQLLWRQPPRSTPDFFVPLMTGDPAPDGDRANPSLAWLQLIGRKRPGFSAGAIQAQMRVELRQWLRSQWGRMGANDRTFCRDRRSILHRAGQVSRACGINTKMVAYSHDGFGICSADCLLERGQPDAGAKYATTACRPRSASP